MITADWPKEWCDLVAELPEERRTVFVDPEPDWSLVPPDPPEHHSRWASTFGLTREFKVEVLDGWTVDGRKVPSYAVPGRTPMDRYRFRLGVLCGPDIPRKPTERECRQWARIDEVIE